MHASVEKTLKESHGMMRDVTSGCGISSELRATPMVPLVYRIDRVRTTNAVTGWNEIQTTSGAKGKMIVAKTRHVPSVIFFQGRSGRYVPYFQTFAESNVKEKQVFVGNDLR